MHPRKGHVLFVIGSLAIGGAEGQLVMLAEELKKRGWTINIFALEKSGPLVERLAQADIRVIDGGYKVVPTITRFRALVALALSQFRLLLHICLARPDILHGYLPLTNFMTALAGRAAFIPLVLTSKRALGTHQDRHPGFKWLDRVSNALSHHIIANSRAVATDTCLREGCDPTKLTVIPNGLDAERLTGQLGLRDEMRRRLGLCEKAIAVVMVANLIPYKGHHELLQAFAMSAAADSRLMLFLIGEDRGIAAQLADQAERLGVSNRVAFLGRRNDVPALLSAMDIGVMSSHEEGFPNALLEKLAVGLPIVATDVGGIPEALEGMPDCILVRPHNPTELSEGLSRIASRLDCAEKSRSTRRRLVRERYSVNAMVGAYEQLYSGVRCRNA